MSRKLIPLVVLLLLALAPGVARAYLPPGFIGMSPQNAADAKDFRLMREAGVENVRWLMFWPQIQSQPPLARKPDWSGFDREVELAAEEGIEIMPVVWGTPDWVAPEKIDLPVGSAWQRSSWTTFLREAVRRYGPWGEFWEDHTKLEYLPIRKWEIWNEENIVTFAHRPDPRKFANLIRISGRILHHEDPGSQVIVGGLFGRPLQIPPNVASGDFVNRLYRAHNVKRYFDGIGLHPYVADAAAMGKQLKNLRRIMRLHHDGATPLYVTELGWGSASGPTRWQRGLYGQAHELDKAFAMLSANRLRWGVAGAWWFTWTDEGGSCSFCGSAGLLNAKREAKPSWYRFNEWTGGDSATVPRIGSRGFEEELSETQPESAE
jgi:polysaccharide biosynthesis protein PslG